MRVSFVIFKYNSLLFNVVVSGRWWRSPISWEKGESIPRPLCGYVTGNCFSCALCYIFKPHQVPLLFAWKVAVTGVTTIGQLALCGWQACAPLRAAGSPPGEGNLSFTPTRLVFLYFFFFFHLCKAEGSGVRSEWPPGSRPNVGQRQQETHPHRRGFQLHPPENFSLCHWCKEMQLINDKTQNLSPRTANER